MCDHFPFACKMRTKGDLANLIVEISSISSRLHVAADGEIDICLPRSRRQMWERRPVNRY